MSSHSFETISIEQFVQRLKEFRENSQDLIKTWQKNEASVFSKIREIKEGKESFLSIAPVGELKVKSQLPILIHFQLSGVDYFAQTDYQKTEGSVIELKITNKVFMVEKRKHYRYLCFPEDEVYYVIDIPKPVGEQAEVLAFDKEKRVETAFLKQFREKVELEHIQTKEGFETMKFRALDISKGGVSLCCSTEELEFYKLENSLKSGYIMVNDKIYNVDVNNIAYIIDYESPNQGPISLKKVGLGFEESDVLNDYLDKLVDSTVIFTQQEKDFENI